jgi:hypothetical protein
VFYCRPILPAHFAGISPSPLAHQVDPDAGCVRLSAAATGRGPVHVPEFAPYDEEPAMDFSMLTVLAQEGDAAGQAGGVVVLLIQLAILVLFIMGLWKIFEKAGKPGWAAIIPIYNLIVILEIVGKPIWWIILFLIPCVNIIIAILVYIDLAKCFGKGAGYGIGLALLPFIFFPLLGFSDAKYQGPVATPT